jgi:sec-independent protein translocase protein TatA
MPNIGPLEIAIVLVIVLIIFGPKRLPELGRSMGKGIRDFKGALSHDDDDEDSVEGKKRELEASQSAETSGPAKTNAEGKPVEGEVITENKA